MTYLDMWRSGTFLEKPQVSALVITNTDHRTTEHSISDSVGDLSWVQKVPLQLYRRNLPNLHTSRYVISSTRPSPMLVLQATNAGLRRPGYEAKDIAL